MNAKNIFNYFFKYVYLSLIIFFYFFKNSFSETLEIESHNNNSGYDASFGEISSGQDISEIQLNQDGTINIISGDAVSNGGSNSGKINIKGKKNKLVDYRVIPSGAMEMTHQTGNGTNITINNFIPFQQGQVTLGKNKKATIYVGANIEIKDYQELGIYNSGYIVEVKYATTSSWSNATSTGVRNLSLNISGGYLDIDEQVEMFFGTFAPDLNGGKIRLNSNDNIIQNIIGQSFIPNNNGGQRASFKINGIPNSNVGIYFSSGDTLTNQSGGSGAMDLSNFKINISSPVSLNFFGQKNIKVGADLAFGPNLEEGNYRGTYTITAIYD